MRKLIKFGRSDEGKNVDFLSHYLYILRGYEQNKSNGIRIHFFSPFTFQGIYICPEKFEIKEGIMRVCHMFMIRKNRSNNKWMYHHSVHGFPAKEHPQKLFNLGPWAERAVCQNANA